MVYRLNEGYSYKSELTSDTEWLVKKLAKQLDPEYYSVLFSGNTITIDGHEIVIKEWEDAMGAGYCCDVFIDGKMTNASPYPYFSAENAMFDIKRSINKVLDAEEGNSETVTENIDDPELVSRNKELKANKITIDTLTYDILDVLEDHGYDADAQDVIDYAESVADLLWNTRGTLNAEIWYEQAIEDSPEELVGLTKKSDESLDSFYEDLKNELEGCHYDGKEGNMVKKMKEGLDNPNSYSKRFEDLGDDLAELLGDVSNNPDILQGYLGEDDLTELGRAADTLHDTAHFLQGSTTESLKESYDDSMYVDIDEVIGTLGRVLEEGSEDPDVFAEVADIYGRLVEMRDAGYQLDTVQGE